MWTFENVLRVWTCVRSLPFSVLKHLHQIIQRIYRCIITYVKFLTACGVRKKSSSKKLGGLLLLTALQKKSPLRFHATARKFLSLLSTLSLCIFQSLPFVDNFHITGAGTGMATGTATENRTGTHQGTETYQGLGTNRGTGTRTGTYFSPPFNNSSARISELYNGANRATYYHHLSTQTQD